MPAAACAARPRDFYAHVSARFSKDATISPDAKSLRLLLGTFADARTGRTHVGLRRIEQLMACRRERRARAQRDLIRAGWLQLERERMSDGRLGCVTFILWEPPVPVLGTVAESGSLKSSVTRPVSHPCPV